MARLNYNFEWEKYFEVNEQSPSGLVRIKDYRGNSVDSYNTGTRVFCKNGDAKAWKLGFQYSDYYVHRIIWVLKNGSIDSDLVIDHLDGNPFNNLISNLSLKTVADNSRNQRKFRNNTTGITGVSRTINGTEKWNYTAHWQALNGKRMFKSFSITKYGEELAKNLAVSYREQQIKHLILEGADYTERHGIDQNY